MNYSCHLSCNYIVDTLSDPPETPPESPIGSFFDDDKLDCMSYFSEDDAQPEGESAVVEISSDSNSRATINGEVSSSIPVSVSVSDHPKFARYFKMLKFGLPLHVVKNKMTLEGVDASIIDKPADEVVPLESRPIEPKATLSNSNVPANNNITVSGATMDDSGEKVALSDHITYGRYFKMLKFGFTVDMVKNKLTLDGWDPEIITRSPSELVSAQPAVSIKGNSNGGGAGDARNNDRPFKLPLSNQKSGATTAAAPEELVRRKTVRVKGVDASRVSANSVWAAEEAEEAEGGKLHLDQEEFNRLFTERVEPAVKSSNNRFSARATVAHINMSGGPSGTGAAAAAPVKKPKGVHLIDLKRAQNAAIALSRIKIPYEELRTKIMRFDDDQLSVDQLLSINEFMPTEKESQLIRQYSGDVSSLGHAEQYMRAMLDFPSASQRIGCMIYKQLFQSRQHDIREKLTAIEGACEDVKQSIRLKRVLRIILKVINHINSGSISGSSSSNSSNSSNVEAGITVDALLRLKETKAFDRKTTILQYVVMLIQRNDPEALLFPADLKHLTEASRLILEAIDADRRALQNEYDKNLALLTSIEKQQQQLGTSTGTTPDTAGSTADNSNSSSGSSGSSGSSSSGIDTTDLTSILSFFHDKAHHQCDEISKKFVRVKAKYNSVLNYFGEDPALPSVEFFGTLLKFVQEFSATVEVVERMRKMELRKARGTSVGKITKSDKPTAAAFTSTSVE